MAVFIDNLQHVLLAELPLIDLIQAHPAVPLLLVVLVDELHLPAAVWSLFSPFQQLFQIFRTLIHRASRPGVAFFVEKSAPPGLKNLF